MNYSFIEIGVSEYDTMSKNSADAIKGILVNPIQELLNDIPDKPNVVKVAKAISWKAGQTQVDVFYLSKQDLLDCGCPEWMVSKISYEALNEYHTWAKHAMHLLEKRTVPAVSLEQLFNDNQVEKLGMLSFNSVDKDPDILLYNLPYLNTRQNKPVNIKFSKERVSEEKTQEVIQAYQTIGYVLKDINGYIVTLQRADLPV